jgi:hypothetical protein
MRRAEFNSGPCSAVALVVERADRGPGTIWCGPVRICHGRKLQCRPAFLSRQIWYQWGFFDRHLQRPVKEYNAWARRNRMGSSLSIYAGHAYGAIIRRNQDVFDGHPEYLSLIRTENNESGEVIEERKGTQFCISNKDLRQLVVDDALAFFKRNPDRDMVSVEPSDGDGHCQCDDCAAIGTVSDQVFLLANVVAKALQGHHRGKYVGLYAYNLHSEPPSFELESNVYVQLTAGFIRGRYSYDELIKLWPEKCQNLGFYDYYSVYQWNWDMPLGGRGANVGYIRDSIRRYREANGTSIDCESGNNWGLHGRGYVLASRLMWNPGDDPAAVIADFYDKAFGPAAEPMRRFYERLDPGSKPLLSEHLLAQAWRDLKEATILAADRPEVLARLDQLKIGQHYVSMRWEHDRASDEQAKKDLTLKILTHVYRNRYTYMNHWEAMRQFWTPRAADTFEPAFPR